MTSEDRDPAAPGNGGTAMGARAAGGAATGAPAAGGAATGAKDTGWWISPLVVGLACLGLLIGGIVIQAGAANNSRTLTASATGSVLAGSWETSHSDCRSSGGSCRKEYECHVRYTFTPAGDPGARPIRGESSDDGHCKQEDHAEGVSRTVYYDPDDPSHNIVDDPETFGNKYAGLFVIGAGFLGLLYSVLKVVRVLRKDKAARSGADVPGTGTTSSPGCE
jgi:hypothetical protein